MDIACPQCGFYRSVPEGEPSAARSAPCPRCSERAKLLGSAHTDSEPPSQAALGKREWHVMWRGLQRGPYARAELCALLDQHREGWAAPVWRPGQGEWRSAAELAELLRAAPPAPTVPAAAPAASLPPRSPTRTAGETTWRLRAVQPLHTRAIPILSALVGGALALAAIVAYLRLRPVPLSPTASPAPPMAAPLREASAATRVVTTPPPNLAASMRDEAPQPAPHARPLDAVAAPEKSAASPMPELPPRVRVRTARAPVRTSAAPEGRVLCSLPKGTLLEVFEQRPGTHARWFKVGCDAHAFGWIHENFARPMQGHSSARRRDQTR